MAAFALAAGCSTDDPPARAPLSINELLKTDDGNEFNKALQTRPFEFPRDHGAHPTFKNEWWYVTGNLFDTNNERYGFQFTLFRNAISVEPVASLSKWATNQTFLAHVAITDGKQDRFFSDERFSRGALGLAGVSHDPFKAWLEDWSLATTSHRSCGACFNATLSVTSDEFDLDLSLENIKPYVLHGDSGLSQKSETPGNASYYYSYTRLQTEGRIRIKDNNYTVHGESWLDHEWSTSSLEQDQVGWDWFSVQLSDHSELMLFQLRHRNDVNKNFVYGTYVDSQGETTQLTGFTINSDDTWSSPHSGAIYPSGWNVTIPNHDIRITLTPIVRAQEINESFRYWEGAVDVEGYRSEQKLSGHGYVELTGYN